MALLTLNNVCKGFGEGNRRAEILDDVNLEVEDGEFLAIVGFSGSGKSTLISLMAGLQAPDAGDILLEGEKIQGPSPQLGVVFQNYSLLPWLTVRGNVALATRSRRDGAPRKVRRDREQALVNRYVDLVGLGAAAEKRPRELSGGMRQRVALARGLAMDPKVLLLDEPLSALDALTRATLQDEIEAIWRSDRKTVVMITNDVDEAILLADRILPLKPGPKATLGPTFRVQLERPRDRKQMNHDPAFKKIRNQITQYLLEVSPNEVTSATSRVLRLPELRPRDLNPPSKPMGGFGQR